MELVLVSSCLIDNPVRCDGARKRSGTEVLQRWLTEGRVVRVCPEIAGGLPVPRPPAEVTVGAGSAAVLAGLAHVVDAAGNDLSAAFRTGARYALEQAQADGIRIAVLKESSPSRGSHDIHDRTFSATRVHGQGVTAALLASAGVLVFSEAQFEEATKWLRSLDMEGGAVS